MKTPSYWNKQSLPARLLLPVGKMYSAATALRLRLKQPQKANVPVICIGNLTAGGTGKTPVAAAMVTLLRQCGYNPAFVSRGYGGNLSGVIVDREKHTARQVGDEPLLLARQAPVSINPDRYRAAVRAVAEGADVIIMDDGFQNPGLYKDISLVVFDGEFGIGNGYPVPAGPLREELDNGLKRASAAVIIGNDRHHLSAKLQGLPIFYARMTAELPPLSGSRVIAFAGIGRPEKFYASLRENGIEPAETIDFPDHHNYSETELQDLIDRAWLTDAELITTAKDFVKIPSAMQHHFKVLEIKIAWDDEKELKRFINNNMPLKTAAEI